MIDRKEFKEELMLRENVRKAIRFVRNRRKGAAQKALREEKQLLDRDWETLILL